MDSLVTFFFVFVGIITLSRAITAKAKERKEAALLERNPEAWKKLKELELEKTHRNRRAAGGVVFTIAKYFLSK